MHKSIYGIPKEQRLPSGKDVRLRKEELLYHGFVDETDK